MKQLFIFENLHSNYCKAIFGLAMIGGYLLTPASALTGLYLFLSVPFIVLFALTIACSVRAVKEKVQVAQHQHTSILGIIASIVGVSAIQACGIGTPLCGASLGMSILSTLFPSLFVQVLVKHSVVILSLSILIQIVTLYNMKCLTTNHNSKQQK